VFVTIFKPSVVDTMPQEEWALFPSQWRTLEGLSALRRKKQTTGRTWRWPTSRGQSWKQHLLPPPVRTATAILACQLCAL
jgi:hypothetical protein